MTYEQALDWFKQNMKDFENHVPFRKAVEALERCIEMDETVKEN